MSFIRLLVFLLLGSLLCSCGNGNADDQEKLEMIINSTDFDFMIEKASDQNAKFRSENDVCFDFSHLPSGWFLEKIEPIYPVTKEQLVEGYVSKDEDKRYNISIAILAENAGMRTRKYALDPGERYAQYVLRVFIHTDVKSNNGITSVMDRIANQELQKVAGETFLDQADSSSRFHLYEPKLGVWPILFDEVNLIHCDGRSYAEWLSTYGEKFKLGNPFERCGRYYPEKKVIWSTRISSYAMQRIPELTGLISSVVEQIEVNCK